MQFKLENVRLSFPSLFRKATFNGVETKYEGTLLLDKVAHKKVIAEIDKSIKAMIADNLKGAKLGADKICMRDGDDVEYAGYAGMMSFKASNKKRPLVVNKDRTPVFEDDNVIYGGCYVNAVVELWAQSNEYGKRINANLLGVQFVRDGEPFASGETISANTFDDISASDFDTVDF
jgi:hypothetical protein